MVTNNYLSFSDFELNLIRVIGEDGVGEGGRVVIFVSFSVAYCC